MQLKPDISIIKFTDQNDTYLSKIDVLLIGLLSGMSLYMLQRNIACSTIITKAIDIVLTTLDLLNFVNTKHSPGLEPKYTITSVTCKYSRVWLLFGYLATLLGVAYPAGCVSCDLNGELIIYTFPEYGLTHNLRSKYVTKLQLVVVSQLNRQGNV